MDEYMLLEEEVSNLNITWLLLYSNKEVSKPWTNVSKALILGIQAKSVAVLKQDLYSIPNLPVFEVTFH